MRGPHPVVPGSVGVLGGAFDPIHIGHLAVAEEAREVLGLETVLFVPTGSPPHRSHAVASAEDRVAMTTLAIDGNPAFQVSRLEVDRSGPSYTVDTLAALAGQGRIGGHGTPLVLIVSGETLEDLPTWREPRRILELARLAVAPRLGHRTPGRAWLAAQFPGLEDRVTYLRHPRLEVSSTGIRERLAAGRSIRYLVPEPVIAYIEEHGLCTTTRAADPRMPGAPGPRQHAAAEPTTGGTARP